MISELRQRMKQHLLRRTKKMLKDKCKLPSRNEFIVPCTMTQAQINIYEQYLTLAKGTLDHLRSNKKSTFNEDSPQNNLAFVVINNLRKICNHPF